MLGALSSSERSMAEARAGGMRKEERADRKSVV